MNIKLLSTLIGIILLYSCSSQTTTVIVLCEQDLKGNYVLKWELYPDVGNTPVEIFVSDNDSVFPADPQIIANSNDYMAMLNNKTDAVEKRKYFRIKVSGILSDVVSNRFFEMDSIQNFRDIGGYTTSDDKRLRWGKIFRSGSFALMTSRDSLVLNNLGIKTIIDLRSEDVQKRNPDRYIPVNNIRIPIAYSGYNVITQKVMAGRFLRGDAIIYTQDTYREMVNNFADRYAAFFDYLCDENNYPVIFHCYLGKDQSGLATFFLLRALGVPMDVIEDDYMASDEAIDRSKLIRNADSLPESIQEAFTMLSRSDLAYLKYGISCIKEKSGSLDDYMLHELKLTPEKERKLRKILLY
ncbi:MAG: tyrosine-protein phosphatase [Prevotella sp.]|jgi:protein-tyrosine phosphatase|nr:tyrosine-protein phosphatase [Prevotella sp.]